MKLKQLLSVVLMLCMIASSCVAFAAPRFDESYECSKVSFGYEDGETWTDALSLQGGQELSAKVSVSKTGDKENAVFSLFVYKNGKMYDNEIVTLEVGSEPVEFKATASVPADPEGCQAVAVLWNNFYDMEMLCDSAIFPSANTKLRGLYADGVLVEGFNPDVTEYNYVLAADAQKYPDISWQAADSSVKVTYKKPTTFPGRSLITVEAADGSKTEYSIKYVSEVGDFISNIGGAATNPVYVKGGMVVGSVAYNDRDYTVTAIGDSDYEGADMIQGSIAWQSNATFKSTAADWITFDAARGVTVKVLKSDVGATQHFIDAGFTMETTDLETGFVQTTTNAAKNHKIAMSKHFDAGKVSIPAGNSSTTYIVAILLDPIGGIDEEDPDEPADPDEPVIPEDTSLMLESISIDGVALEGFEASTNEYTHVLTTAQLTKMTSPEVTYALKDETSTAEVSMPESFPGSVTITVTNAEEEKAEYVINYDAKNMVTNFATDVEVAKSAVYVPGGLKIGGNVASDRMGDTQWKISEHVASIEGGDTILTPVAGWVGVVNTFNFDLARKGTLTVIQNQTNQLSAYEEIGFTADADVTSTKVKILNNDGSDYRTYRFMASKEVEAGKITLPYTKPNMPVLTVFRVEPWSNEVQADESTLLSDIKIDGVSIEGFDSKVNTYTVNLTAMQLAAKEAPEVTYTFADGESSATMERPSSFPGSVKITVYGKDSNTNTYTINYFAETVKDLALNEAAGANAPQPVYMQNFKVGDATYSDRPSNFLTSYIDEAYVGKDRIIYGLGWKNDWNNEYYTAFTGERVDWVTFTAARDMEVMVFEAANANSEYVGFTAETSTTPYITAAASSNGDLNYKYKYTKKFSAGDKVALPNVDVSNRIGTVVLNVAPWGGFGEEGGDEPDTPVVPDEPEESLEIMKVKDGKDSIVVFVHDDGDYATASYLTENFLENGLKGSVGFIVNRIKDTNKATWQELFDTGVLNAESHSMTHTYVGQDNTKDETAMVNGVETQIPAGKMETEIADSKTKLKEFFPNQNPLVYIRPGVGTVTDMEGNPLTATNANAIAMMKEHYIAARVTGRTAFTKQGVDTIPPTDYFAMYSIMPGNGTTYEDMMASVDEAVSENGILVFCFHGISDELSDSNATRKSETDKVFADVGEYVAEGKVWNPFYSDAVKYMKETEAAKATMETAGDAIEVTLTDELDNEIFDYPLTVKVPVPNDWEYALLTQGEKTENPKTFTEGDETFVYANIVPDGGKATLVKSDLIVDDLALTSIKIDGAEIKAFEEGTTEYSYTLSPNQVKSIEAPIVTYTLADAQNSSAVVTNPTEFPGSVTITVTNKDSETRTYTVNYRSNAVLTDITVADSSVRNADFVSGGFVVGETPYHNRSAYTIQEINDESLIGKDYFKGNIDWQNNATFKSATYTPWITMNAQRKVKVTILKTANTGDSQMVENGFTSAVSTNANGFVKADTNSEKNFKYAYTKEFEAGEVVIPNGMTNKAYFVVFSYAPWGTEDAGGSDEPFYDQSLEVAPFNGDILVSGSFRANTEEGKGYYVVLESYEDGELIKTEKSEKFDLTDGRNTFNISFGPSFAVQNVKAYVEAEDGTVICQPEEITVKTLKHLFIGNSFSVNAHKYLYEIAQDAGFNNIVLGTIYKGGCSLETHALNAENNTADYTYYKNTAGEWNTTADTTMLYGIKDENWMTISFQQASTDSGKPETYEPFLTNLMAYVDENKTNPDAKYVWHMTWAYAQDKVSSKYEKDQMYMYNAIVNAVQTKVLTKDAIEIVIPSGTAIQNARTSTVGDTLNGDGTHLEAIHGCYIAGLMTFKALTGADLADVTYDSGFTHENFLAIAKESVNNAYDKPYEVTKSAYAPAETVGLVKAIKVDGNAVENFDAETLTYDVTLTDNQMAAFAYPDVTAELNDTEASVNVSEPTSFPGSVNVTVTKGEESKTYTINFVLPEIEVALSEDAHETTSYPQFATGINVGDTIFADRTTFPVEAINDSEITSDIIWLKTNLSWQNTPPMSDVYTTTVMPDFITFTAKRGMVVTVYEDTTNNGNKFNYWTTETSDTPYILGTHSNPLKYTVKHRRYYEAGDTVEIPNARGSRVFTSTIKYLGWGEEAPELDVTIPVVRKISDSDLVTKVVKGDGINVTEGQWSGLSDITTTKYQLSKEFANVTEPTEISITTDKIAKGYGIIVVAPLDSEAADKNVIVNADGSELEWTEDINVVADYSYTNGGDEDFDEANATFARYNDSAVTFSGGTAYVYEKMHNSDDMYITGSKLGGGREPYLGELHWTGLPEEYIGCNYIVVNFNSGFNGGERTFTFTVNQPVKVWVHSSASNMTVTDTVDETEWTASQYVVRRRFQNVLDHLSCAYMIRKGYINESNIVYDGTVGSTNGVRFNRYDVYEKLKADCGTYLGWAIDPEKVEATGFTDSINDYRYKEYLEAWVD